MWHIERPRNFRIQFTKRSMGNSVNSLGLYLIWFVAIRSASIPRHKHSIGIERKFVSWFSEVNRIAFISKVIVCELSLNENQVFIGDETFHANDIYRVLSSLRFLWMLSKQVMMTHILYWIACSKVFSLRRVVLCNLVRYMYKDDGKKWYKQYYEHERNHITHIAVLQLT